MNLPSTIGGINWQWRMEKKHYDKEKAEWLKKISMLYGRNIRN
jgi:4-alpha-glucanotransferase